MEITNMYQSMGISKEVYDFGNEILAGLKERFEIHHGVTIEDKSLIAASTLSNRYITDRFLPDKAIDLIDQACAGIKVDMESMPLELDELHRRIRQLEIEEVSLKKETDEKSKLEEQRVKARGQEKVKLNLLLTEQ